MKQIKAAPKAVQTAFKHVKTFFPSVCKVDFDEDCVWTYTDDKGDAPDFSGHPVSTEILEAAADAQYNIGVPVTYCE